MKYNRKLYPIIILIAMTVIFKCYKCFSSKTLFGGGENQEQSIL